MRSKWISFGLAVAAVGIMTPHANGITKPGHHSKSAPVAVGAENQLLGVHLYDSSLHVIDLYGSPDQLEPLSIGGGQQAGGGFGGGSGFGGGGARGGFGAPGAAGPGGPGSFGAPGMPGPGAPGIPGRSGADFNADFDFGNDLLGQGPGMRGPGGMGAPTAGPPAGAFPGAGGGRPGGFGGPGGFPGGGGPGVPGGPGGFGGRGAGGGAGIPSAGGGAYQAVTYTRWVYNRHDNKYAFIVDKNGRVIQIEAIGITNPKVKTKRGIGFGSTFASIIQKYHNPDGYEIGGDNIMVKYLVEDKVAFRLSRLEDKKPHQVTGIVISAGKG